MEKSLLFITVILLTTLSCKKSVDLNVKVTGTVIDITNNSAVNDMYINFIYCRGLGNYSLVNSSKTDINGKFELNYKLEDKSESLSIAVNNSPDPSNHIQVLPQYDYCFPCSSISDFHAGDNSNITISVTRYTTLIVSATTNTPLTGNDYISAEIPGSGTCCISQFPITVDKIPAKKDEIISWTVKRNGIVNSYQQTIVCQADTTNYFTINY